MDYKKHTQNRFIERFKMILSDKDYKELCQLTKTYNNFIMKQKSKKVYKKIIHFKNKYMWCVYNRRNTVFTVYPIHGNDKLNYKINGASI